VELYAHSPNKSFGVVLNQTRDMSLWRGT